MRMHEQLSNEEDGLVQLYHPFAPPGPLQTMEVFAALAEAAPLEARGYAAAFDIRRARAPEKHPGLTFDFYVGHSAIRGILELPRAARSSQLTRLHTIAEGDVPNAHLLAVPDANLLYPYGFPITLLSRQHGKEPIGVYMERGWQPGQLERDPVKARKIAQKFGDLVIGSAYSPEETRTILQEAIQENNRNKE